MARLIIVPQYPTPLRYQEWWWEEFPAEFAGYFDEVKVLGERIPRCLDINRKDFAPTNPSVEYELHQISEYMLLTFREDDVLLLCDLSFPGLFANVLFHKRPKKCFAICHATSKNKYDYFSKDRTYKWPIEKATAGLFDKIFVATGYHKVKLGWKNSVVQPLPLPPFGRKVIFEGNRLNSIVSVSRPGIQKRNKSLEKKIESHFGPIKTPKVYEVYDWMGYQAFLQNSKVLLITSKEETFGYQVADAIFNGCYPVAPNKYSYPELLPREFLYNDYMELVKILYDLLMHPGKKLPKLLTEEASDNFYKITSDIMKNG